MSKVTLEIAVFSVQSALDAIQAGRIELNFVKIQMKVVLPHPMEVY